MDDLKVPKRRTPVEMILPGGLTRRVDVFLSEFASNHVGPERLSDLLNGNDRFVPGLDTEAGTMSFMHREAVIVARVSHEVENVVEQHTIPTEHEVEVTLTDGTRLSGLITYVRPPERNRLNDYLNEGVPFFPLLEKQHVALINKQHVARVTHVKR